MQQHGLATLLENPERQWFYSSPLGGLSDNLMTIGGFAGSFLTCTACGTTFTTIGSSWRCHSCGREFTVASPSAARMDHRRRSELTA
jgi:hypothetical protein